MGSLDYMKRKILELIDESDDPWLKAAFYGDPKVSAILDRLVSEWESNGRKGIPLDYATPDEVEALYSLASRYASMTTAELQALTLRRMEGRSSEAEGSEKGESIWRRLFRLFKQR